MRKALLIGISLLGAAAACPARAEPPPATGHTPGWVIQPGKWAAVGAGVVAGVVAMEILVPTQLIYVVGSAAGGYLANTWYDGRRVEIHTVP